MAKGSSFERWLCKRLSEWWTQDEPNGPRDDVFWRTAGSGARATVRGKQGQNTVNSHGDICAIDPVGQPLIDCICIEAKVGYNRATIHDLIDPLKPSKAREKKGCWEGWIAKAERSRKASGVQHWAIIHKRDRREPVILYPNRLWDRLESMCGYPANMNFYLRVQHAAYSGMRLGSFFEWVKPEVFLKMNKKGKP